MAPHIYPTLSEKIWRRFTKDPLGGCWLWTGNISPDGYPKVSRGGRNSTANAHRVVYELIVGPIPEGLTLDHLCRVRHCVNPSHLEPVTHRENIQRGLHGRLKTHCRNGLHPWIPENISGAHRHCRLCLRANRERAGKKRKLARLQ